MKITKEATIVRRDEQDLPTHIVLFNGKEHTFFSLEKCGMDELERLLTNTVEEKKI